MAGARTAIQDAMRTKLIADATLATLTGAAGADKRVYSGFDKPEHVADSTKPGFVAIWPITGRTPEKDRESKRYHVSCFAKKLLTANAMADRVDAVLHRKTLSATGWTDVTMFRVGETPAYQDDNGLFQVNLDYEVQVY